MKDDLIPEPLEIQMNILKTNIFGGGVATKLQDGRVAQELRSAVGGIIQQTEPPPLLYSH